VIAQMELRFAIASEDREPNTHAFIHDILPCSLWGLSSGVRGPTTALPE
jgi:hypothetical protein